MKILDQKFTDDTVEVDGNQFAKCIFSRCQMIFRARAPVSFVSCTFDDITWHFDDAAGLTMAFLKALSDGAEDYGRLLIINTFPGLREWMKDEYLRKLEPSNG